MPTEFQNSNAAQEKEVKPQKEASGKEKTEAYTTDALTKPQPPAPSAPAKNNRPTTINS